MLTLYVCGSSWFRAGASAFRWHIKHDTSHDNQWALHYKIIWLCLPKMCPSLINWYSHPCWTADLCFCLIGWSFIIVKAQSPSWSTSGAWMHLLFGHSLKKKKGAIDFAWNQRRNNKRKKYYLCSNVMYPVFKH